MSRSTAERTGIRASSVIESDPFRAASRLAEEIGGEGTGLAVVFCSPKYDHDVLARALSAAFGPVPVIGCTTAGEIGPLGYIQGGLAGFSFGADELVFETGLIQNVSTLPRRDGQAAAYGLRQRLAERLVEFDPKRCFAFLLVDGLCVHEENVARSLSDGLGGIILVGGSAGDGLRFAHTAVLYDGRFHSDAALLLLGWTPRRFQPIKHQHFLSGTRRHVITGANPEKHVVTEINGFPAAEEYARAIGCRREDLSPEVFAAHPMAVKVGGVEFVRSIQQANPDGSLTFFCAVDEGMVLEMTEPGDLTAELSTLFENLEHRIGPLSLVIGCDCILRRLEIERKGVVEQVSAIMRAHHVVGFSTYGEQFHGMHVTQTFTGIAFGQASNL